MILFNFGLHLQDLLSQANDYFLQLSDLLCEHQTFLFVLRKFSRRRPFELSELLLNCSQSLVKLFWRMIIVVMKLIMLANEGLRCYGFGNLGVVEVHISELFRSHSFYFTASFFSRPCSIQNLANLVLPWPFTHSFLGLLRNSLQQLRDVLIVDQKLVLRVQTFLCEVLSDDQIPLVGFFLTFILDLNALWLIILPFCFIDSSILFEFRKFERLNVDLVPINRKYLYLLLLNFHNLVLLGVFPKGEFDTARVLSLLADVMEEVSDFVDHFGVFVHFVLDVPALSKHFSVWNPVFKPFEAFLQDGNEFLWEGLLFEKETLLILILVLGLLQDVDGHFDICHVDPVFGEMGHELFVFVHVQLFGLLFDFQVLFQLSVPCH